MFSSLYRSGEGSVPELKTYYDFCFDDEPRNPLVQLYESWLDEIERHQSPGTLLDVGCGTGLFLSVARRRGWDPFGIDECEEALAYARDQFGLEVWAGRFAEFATGGRYFDVVTGWDIIEHAREPLEFLQAMRDCLAPGGLLGISTPNQRSILDLVAGALYRATAHRLTWPLEKFYIEQHFLYYSPDTLAASLTSSDLDLICLRRESTDLRRLTMSPPMFMVLRVLFAAARVLGLENRLFAVARARSGDGDSGSASGRAGGQALE